MVFIDFLMKIAAVGVRTSPKSMKIIGISMKIHAIVWNSWKTKQKRRYFRNAFLLAFLFLGLPALPSTSSLEFLEVFEVF